MGQQAVRRSGGIAWNYKTVHEECAEDCRQEVEQIDDTDSPRVGAGRCCCDLFHHFSSKFTMRPTALPNVNWAVGVAGAATPLMSSHSANTTSNTNIGNQIIHVTDDAQPVLAKTPASCTGYFGNQISHLPVPCVGNFSPSHSYKEPS